jgi:sugar phosphate isomerase/epimerase
MEDTMNKILLASQLYILRNECAEDLPAVLAKLGDIGFEGVEFLGFFGNSAETVRDKMDVLGLVSVGNHVSYNEFATDTSGVIDFNKKAGCSYITIGTIPQPGLPGREGFPDTIRELTRIGKACKEEGITLLYHNHALELSQKANGKFLLEAIMDEVHGDYLSLEPDLGWMAIAGVDPAYFLDKYKDRCPIIHFKDFYASDIAKIGNVGDLGEKRGSAENAYFEFRPLGYGIGNIPQYINKVLACKPEWIVMDHDIAYERDSYEDLRTSLEYTRQLLAML